MDYPKSVPSVGLVNGRFIDENPLLGTTGSLIPSAWGNAVTDELLSILTAAGIAPSEASTNQVLAALRGSGLFQTAALFNSSKLAATTEFVQQSLGNFSGGRDENRTGFTLPTSDIGQFVALVLVTTQTVALPLLSNVPTGGTITLHNPTTVDKIITVNGGDKISPDGTMYTVVSIKQGDTARFTKESGVWRLHGVGALKYSAQFGASVVGSGYQKLPTGLIIQWGMTAAISSGANLVHTLPIAFPNSIFHALTTYNNAAADAVVGSTYIGQVKALATSSITVRNLGSTPAQYSYLAIGN